jgi:hypothetical protein
MLMSTLTVHVHDGPLPVVGDGFGDHAVLMLLLAQNPAAFEFVCVSLIFLLSTISAIQLYAGFFRLSSPLFLFSLPHAN